MKNKIVGGWIGAEVDLRDCLIQSKSGKKSNNLLTQKYFYGELYFEKPFVLSPL